MALSITDLDALQWVATGTLAVVTPVVAYVTNRVLKSASRQELMDAITAINKRVERHEQEDDTRFGQLMDKANKVAEDTADIKGYLRALKDERGL